MAEISYAPVNWEDRPSTDTPVNAANLSRMETGIKDCVNKINSNLFASDSLEFKFSKSGTDYGYQDANGNFVPFKTTHTQIKNITSNGTTDMGVNHKYRYVNVAVPSQYTTRDKSFTKSYSNSDGGETITITADAVSGYTCVGNGLISLSIGEWFRHAITSIDVSNPSKIVLVLSKATGDWSAFTLSLTARFFYIKN